MKYLIYHHNAYHLDIRLNILKLVTPILITPTKKGNLKNM